MAMSSPGMTSANSFESQQASFENPMLQNRLFHVLTACGCKPAACRKKRRNHILVDQNRKYGYISQAGFKHLLYLLVWHAVFQPN